MKKTVLLFIIAFCTQINAQCGYSSVFMNNSTKSLFLKLEPLTIDIYETPFNGRLILATLIRNGDLYYIDFEITRDSSAQELEPHCFDKDDSIILSLADNTEIELSHIRDRICGIKLEQNDDFVSVTDYMRVIVTSEALEKLSENEVILIKFKGKEFDKTVVLKSELEELYEDDIVITNPTKFFKNNIDCLINPKLK
jgi:hypothetical protein